MYLFNFDDLRAICRRVYHQINPLTHEGDQPHSYEYIGKEAWPYKDWTGELVTTMNSQTQVVVIICTKKDALFAPIFGGVFDLFQTGE